MVASRRILKVVGENATEVDDLLAEEMPLEIRLGFGPALLRQQQSISVTMRTPGHDFELTLGFLLTEGIVNSSADIAFLEYCRQVKSEDEYGHVVKAELREGIDVDLVRLQRNFYTSSSCGVCGKASLDAVEAQGCKAVADDGKTIAAALMHTLPEIAYKSQVMFRHTGGNHAAALFDWKGELKFLREDIGRHNAVDKVIGAMHPLGESKHDGAVLFLSGRAGFELVQKAAMAGIPVVAAVGAPSALAVDLAEKFNITLVGYLRNGRFNIYSGEKRIELNLQPPIS